MDVSEKKYSGVGVEEQDETEKDGRKEEKVKDIR